jgi:hypothetical protein
VLAHTGNGHLIQECRLDINRVRSDFQDVKTKCQNLIEDAELTKAAFDSADRKLGDMCHKQVNKLEIAYKSMIKALESKKKEYLNVIVDFYTD